MQFYFIFLFHACNFQRKPEIFSKLLAFFSSVNFAGTLSPVCCCDNHRRPCLGSQLAAACLKTQTVLPENLTVALNRFAAAGDGGTGRRRVRRKLLLRPLFVPQIRLPRLLQLTVRNSFFSKKKLEIPNSADHLLPRAAISTHQIFLQ
ncbi:hypothetical protein U1Q18_006014 [Sarracenia purpurea var. burkii]